jgi:hypothetical protein
MKNEKWKMKNDEINNMSLNKGFLAFSTAQRNPILYAAFRHISFDHIESLACNESAYGPQIKPRQITLKIIIPKSGN